MTWDVDHMREPDDGTCPVCGNEFSHAVEKYPRAETTIVANDDERYCVIAGVASASPDPTLIVVQH